MISGLDWSSWATVTDGKAMLTQREIIDVAYIRVWTGFGDDQEFDNVNGVSYRKLLDSTTTPHGAVLWGPYMFLGYSAKVGSLNWSALGGQAQAQSAWARATNGGRTHQLPVAIDVERNAFIEWGGVRQIVPFPSVEVYAQTYLLPAIEHLTQLQGRRPVIYSNPDTLLNYLAPILPTYKAITECPLWVASYSSGANPAYWDRISKFWPQWLLWQNAGDVRDWPGISDVDHNKAQGTRSQWKAWAADASAALPKDGATDPVDPPPVVDPPADLAELTARVAELERWRKS